mmetsp:Transcript_39320/g.62988  ORF Transcript_39320/g.62988 Transcript_39320/m.62988 type:complete len:765 (+) Transcript_39320:141-2435(+)
MQWEERARTRDVIFPIRRRLWKLRATLLFLLLAFTSLRLVTENRRSREPFLRMPRKLSGLKPSEELREKIDTSLRLREWSLRSSQGGGIAGEPSYEAPTYHRFTGYAASVDQSSIQDELPNFISLYSQLLHRAVRDNKTRVDSMLAHMEAGNKNDGIRGGGKEDQSSSLETSAHSSIKDDNETHTFAFNTMLEACARKQQWGEMWNVMKKLISVGIVGNSWTISLYIQIVENVGQWKHIVQLYEGLKDSGIKMDVEVYNLLLLGCLKYGQWNVAEAIYERLQNTAVEANAKTYNLMIATLEKTNHWERALRMYVKMVSSGVMPETSTYNSLMNTCRKAGRYNKALIVFQLLRAQNLEPDGTTYAHMNALILASSKAGDWVLTCKVFDEMKEANIRPDSTTYSALIFALTKKGDIKNGLKQFFQMCEEGVLPSMEAFATVILACINDKDFNTAREALKQTKSLNLSLDYATFNLLMEAIEASEGSPEPLSNMRNRLTFEGWKNGSSSPDQLLLRPEIIVDKALARAALRYEGSSVVRTEVGGEGRSKRMTADRRRKGDRENEEEDSLLDRAYDVVKINREGIKSRMDLHLLSLSSSYSPLMSTHHTTSANTEDQENNNVHFTGSGSSPLPDSRKEGGGAQPTSSSSRRKSGENVLCKNPERISESIKEVVDSAADMYVTQMSPEHEAAAAAAAQDMSAKSLPVFSGIMKRQSSLRSHIGIRGGGKRSRTSEESHVDHEADDGSTHSEVLTDAEWAQFLTVGKQKL